MKTLDEVLEELTAVASAENYHEMCDLYPRIAKLVAKHAGSAVALRVMIEIADEGGWLF